MTREEFEKMVRSLDGDALEVLDGANGRNLLLSRPEFAEKCNWTERIRRKTDVRTEGSAVAR